MPHVPLGIFDITLVAGNDVNMDMEDTLLGRRPHVYADIVTAGVELRVQQAALLGDQLHAGPDLFRRQVEKAGDMTTRDDQGMTRAHRVAISRAVRKFVTQRHPSCVSTEQARAIGVTLVFLFFSDVKLQHLRLIVDRKSVER